MISTGSFLYRPEIALGFHSAFYSFGTKGYFLGDKRPGGVSHPSPH